MDEGAAAELRAALGLRPGDPGPADLGAAAAVLTAAGEACRLDAGSVVLLAVTLARQVRARRGPATRADLDDLAAVLLACTAAWCTDEQLDGAERAARDLP